MFDFVSRQSPYGRLQKPTKKELGRYHPFIQLVLAGDLAAAVAELEAAGARIVKGDVTDTASSSQSIVPRPSLPFWTSPLDTPPFRTVVDHAGQGPQIALGNDLRHHVTRTVLTNFGIEQMRDLNA